MTKQNKRNLVVIKKEAYVWRVQSWGMGENFNHIPCWYVVDKDTDEIILGGYSSGSNSQSGYAQIKRRKDAKAFIDGYNAEKGADNPHDEMIRSKNNVGRYSIASLERKLKGADDETSAFWDDGNNFKEHNGKRKLFSDIGR